MLQSDRSKLILLFMVISFGMFIQYTSNEIPDSYMMLITNFLSAFIGIMIKPNNNNNNKDID